jgi:hypothetical protein
MNEDRLPLTSQDVLAERLAALRELFPEVFIEILKDTIRQILNYQPKPKQFISLDSSFRGKDQLKTNIS